MEDQRPFRFRLPWLSASFAPAPRPAAEPQPPRPTVQIQAPARPTTTIPIQRSPFRPAGIARTPAPPTQITAQERTGPQPPPRAATESQTTSQPSSPFRATSRETRAASVPPSPSRTPQSRAASVPPSPSRATVQTQAASQTQSTSRATPQSRAAFVPPSSRTSSQPRTAALSVQQPESPSRLASRVPGKTSSQYSSPSKPTGSRSPSKKLQTEIRAEDVSRRQQQAEPVQTSGAVRAATPTSVTALEIPAASQKSDSKTIGADHPVTLSEQLKKVSEDIFERKKTTPVSSNGETAKSARARYALGESHKKPSMSTGEKVPLHKEIREDISKFIQKLGMEHIKHPIGEKPVSIVILAGENRGASMHVGSEPARKDGSVHNHRGYKINPDESSEAPTDAEGGSKGGKSQHLPTKEDPAMEAYINSNTQSVNNSILFESSLNERSPGVQLRLSHNEEEPSEYSAVPGPVETHRAEFVTPAEMHAYEPPVKDEAA
ncbi:hypothetical protein OIU76_001432 [Salix suchowensis]|nr:hypothetical protein OIU76_001432 [Salix suchowensis]